MPCPAVPRWSPVPATEAIALELDRAGTRVVLVGRQLPKLEAVAAELGNAGRVAVCDTSSEASTAQLAAELRDERISILVNNAGIAGPVAALTDIALCDWMRSSR